jgi:hypothetical protein
MKKAARWSEQEMVGYLDRINRMIDWAQRLDVQKYPHPKGFDDWGNKWLSGEDRKWRTVVKLHKFFWKDEFEFLILAAKEWTETSYRKGEINIWTGGTSWLQFYLDLAEHRIAMALASAYVEEMKNNS